ncbi:hypothetical protein ACNTMW_13065 [Planosporangium sp. 12N6]|uniref:hypothetical protein n=1 Tax=Planosporangium spinosum TaxID=3402278 RepID=UPI003CF49AED
MNARPEEHLAAFGARLEEHLAVIAARLDPGQPYRDPRPGERRLAVSALGHVLRARPDPLAAAAAFARLGFAYTDEVDAGTGRRYAMYRDGVWGVVAVDLSAPAGLVVEVPHPHSDLCTERMGACLFALTPGAVLVMAGAHRRAGGGAADVAHNDGSLFHALAAEAARRRLPQLQLHGFADRNLPDVDAVVSTGAPAPAPAAVRAAGHVADHLAALGLATRRSGDTPGGYLEGTRNVQARTASRAGTVFVHLELSRRVRADGRLRAGTARALAAAGLAE